EWLHLTKLGEHSAPAVPRGRVYLPSSSYREMMTWALPTEARLTVEKALRELEKDDPQEVLPFVLGAPWRAFLAKYPEVNHLQKRMLLVSNELHENTDPPEGAVRELYRAQCNCAYWHGVFGGIYLGFMRGALWHHLMRAEGMVAGLDAGPAVKTIDMNADTLDEILIHAPWGAAVISPHQGGALIELDDWRVGANVLAVVARHREAYHLREEDPGDVEAETDDDEMPVAQARSTVDRDSLVFDEYERGALVDYIDGERVANVYEYSVEEGGLARLWTSVSGLRIEKKVSADADELIATYEITNVSGGRHEGTFATEASVMPLNLGREVKGVEVEATDSGWSVTQPEAEVLLEVDLGGPARIESESIETASASFEGLQKMSQGVAVTATWDLELDAGETFSVETRWRLIVNEAALTKTERGVAAAL
ncbi:MAG: 4-alpha-glucanotransferase, partial [Actinomycetota bacterium]|nr:4-alpha-glucanotransferase [Actinomycetota bacterium]